MLKALIKSRLEAMLSSFMGGGNKKRKNGASRVVLLIVFAFCALYMIAALSLMFAGLSMAAKETNDGAAVFTLASLISTALCIFGSIFTTKTQIFDSKDNELLLSMPIPPKYIFVSRIISLLLVNYLMSSLILLPAMVTYGIFYGYNLFGFISVLVIYLLIPVITLAISSVIGWIISLIASRMKHKSVVTVIMSVLFFSVYMYVCFGLGFASGSGEEMEIDFAPIKNIPFFSLCGRAVSENGYLELIFFTLCAILPAILVYFILDKSFISIITTKKTVAKTAYVEKEEKRSSILSALLSKEIKTFFSSSAYVVNEGLGSLMCVIIAVILAVKAPSLFSEMPNEAFEEIKLYIPLFIAGITMFMSSMTMITAPSISIEDRRLWILQTAPIDTKNVIYAKLLCHIIVGAPLSVLSAVILSVALKINIISAILCALIAFGAIAVGGYIGMLLGLKFPKFGWQNENVALKQGFAVFGTMLLNMLWAIAQIIVGIALSFISPYASLLGMLFICVVTALPIHIYLSRRGGEIFNNLQH